MAELTARLMHLVASTLAATPERLGPNTHFVKDLGMDSLESADLVIAIEDTFHVELPDDLLDCLETISDLSSYLTTAPRLSSGMQG